MTDRQWVLVVTVDSVRKGTLKVGQVVYLHGWNPENVPPVLRVQVGTDGCRALGKRGSSM